MLPYEMPEIHETVQFGQRVLVGPYTSIHEGCRLDDDVHVGATTVVQRNSHLMKNVVLGEHSWVGENVIIPANKRIGTHARIMHSVTDLHDVGVANGLRYIVASVNGRAYIGFGHEWLPLKDAITRTNNTAHAAILLQCAAQIATALQWHP